MKPPGIAVDPGGVMDTIKPLVTAAATVVGGRNGHAAADDGSVSVDWSVPKAMGGPGKRGTPTPEQICPYSHPTRNNVAVEFEVAGG
jgi:organic hydroperoxide reductase OsmC/OhrA